MASIATALRLTPAPTANVNDDAPHEVAVGATVDGRYLIKRVIAFGGMGVIFEAQQLFTQRTIALKLLTRDASRREDLRDRLLREAHALTAVAHPGFVEVLDAGVCRRHGPFVALEMLEGRPLDGILTSRGRLSVADTMSVARQMCSALAFAHARGVFHRDVKPSNVFVAKSALGHEVVKLIDLGIACLPGSRKSASERRLTKADELLGTPEYMPPEQLMAQPIDARADVYSIAATLYECLTGAPPFTGTYPQILMQVSRARAVPSLRATRADVSERLAMVIERGLMLAPEHRQADAAELLRALEQAVSEPLRPTALLGELTASARSKPASPPIAARATPNSASGSRPKGAPPPLPAMDAQRRFARAPYVTPVLLFDDDGLTIEGRSEDVSAGGLLVITSRVRAPGDYFRVRFALPGSGEVAVLTAIVRWTRPTRGKTALGLAFSSVPQAALKQIETFVEAHATSR